jgi:hypothetical protein
MEIFRRLGVAKALRDAGLPADYPNDVAYRTSFTGKELSRIRFPRARPLHRHRRPDGWWPTPEPPHRINQIYLEPVLFAHAEATPGVRMLNRTRIDDFEQDADGVRATGRRPGHGRAKSHPLPVPGRLRRRPLGGAQEDRRQACTAPTWWAACSRPTSARLPARGPEATCRPGPPSR